MDPGDHHRRPVVHRSGTTSRRSSAIRFVGFRNYWEIFTIFDNRLFPALFNNFVLLLWLFVCSAIGMLFAYLLDKNLRGGRFYQSVFYFPVVLSLAVVGFMWKSVMFSRDRGLLNTIWPGGPIDFVGDQTKIFEIDLPLLDFPLGLSRNFAALLIAQAWRHIGYVMVLYLAGLKAVDNSLREAASDRRLQRVAVVPPRHLPVAEADQRGRRRDHRDRGAAGVRHRRRPQHAAGHRGDGHVGDDQPRRRGWWPRRAPVRPTGWCCSSSASGSSSGT